VPLDRTTVKGDTVYLQGVRMRRINAITWELSENGKALTLARAKSAAEETS
jgi:hypothetical protein